MQGFQIHCVLDTQVENSYFQYCGDWDGYQKEPAVVCSDLLLEIFCKWFQSYSSVVNKTSAMCFNICFDFQKSAPPHNISQVCRTSLWWANFQIDHVFLLVAE